MDGKRTPRETLEALERAFQDFHPIDAALDAPWELYGGLLVLIVGFGVLFGLAAMLQDYLDKKREKRGPIAFQLGRWMRSWFKSAPRD